MIFSLQTMQRAVSLRQIKQYSLELTCFEMYSFNRFSILSFIYARTQQFILEYPVNNVNVPRFYCQ
jgi:hypothetical protein